MAQVTISFGWKYRKHGIRLFLYLLACIGIMRWLGGVGVMAVYVMLLPTYVILAQIDREKEKHNGDPFPTFEKWKQSLFRILKIKKT